MIPDRTPKEVRSVLLEPAVMAPPLLWRPPTFPGLDGAAVTARLAGTLPKRGSQFGCSLFEYVSSFADNCYRFSKAPLELITLQMIDASAEELTLKLLPHSDVPLQLSKLFADEHQHLEALGEALTADRARSVLIRMLKGEKESFLLSTPRHRVRFFEDRYSSQTAIVLSVEENTFYRWEGDRKKGTPYSVIWTTRQSQPSATGSITLDRRSTILSNNAPAGFWEFWGSVLDKEREALQALVAHPGWPYSQRRVGLNGGVEFKVGDDRDAILQNCGSTFLIRSAARDRSGENREHKFPIFEIQHSEAGDWIAAAPRKPVGLSEIPIEGIIFIDWTGAAAELKRRQDSLNRLRSGDAALPGLAEMLPKGPTTSLPPVPFTKIIPTAHIYNAEQEYAIAKALAPASLTCILGPPGTGKTTVIAEIAAQLASEGKRVLISAQSNLAVDNALEKVTCVDHIFAVRIGRPESVKLNPELLLDRASARYRDRLLAASRHFEETMRREDEVAQNLPSEALLDEWIDQCTRHRQLQNAVTSSQEENRVRQDANVRAMSALHAAELRLNTLCADSGLSIADAELFLQATRDLINAGIAPAYAYNKRSQITFARNNGAEIAKIVGISASIAQITVERKEIDREITYSQRRVVEWKEKEGFLWTAKTANATYDREKKNAGFFKSLWLGVTGPPHDLADLETKLAHARVLRDRAESLLPSLRSNLDQLDRSIAAETDECMILIQSITGERAHLGDMQGSVESWSADLELVKKVELAGVLPYIEILNEHQEIDDAMSVLKRATSAAQLTKAQLQQSDSALLAAIQHLDASPDPGKNLAALSESLKLTAPADLISNPAPADHTASNALRIEAFFAALRTRRNELAIRAERWPVVLEALSRYRSRLNQPFVDLQQPVLSESNVIGATCSAIAGTKDFDSDFDCVIVDEAGRTTPLDLLMPIVRGKSIVLVGDHKQLPPFMGEQLKEDLTDTEKALVDRSIFENIYESSHEERRQALRKQYRMAPAICDIVSEISYQDPSLRIESAGLALDRNHKIPGLGAVHWIIPTGPKNVPSSQGDRGLVNQAEIEATLDIFERIASRQTQRIGDPYSIGIISMYKRQSQAIERKLANIVRSHPTIHVEIGTVDSFQGREKDAIILTFSETDPKRKRFFYDRRRLNVALSRGKELLVIIGNLDKLGANRLAFGDENPLFELRFLIESGIGTCASKEKFHA